jgi:hypothetical protein
MRIRQLIDCNEALVNKGDVLGFKGADQLIDSKLKDMFSIGQNTYMVVRIGMDGGKPFDISGSKIRIASWINDTGKNNNIDSVEILTLSKDRNITRKIADEV